MNPPLPALWESALIVVFYTAVETLTAQALKDSDVMLSQVSKQQQKL